MERRHFPRLVPPPVTVTWALPETGGRFTVWVKDSPFAKVPDVVHDKGVKLSRAGGRALKEGQGELFPGGNDERVAASGVR